VPTNYLDFDVLIERSGERYRARVLNSPAGQAAVEFERPLSSLELENFVLRIARSLGEARRNVRRLESSEREAAKTVGHRLFEAVFRDDVQSSFRASLNEAERRGAGLRLRIRLDVPELADLPWELLYNPAQNRFFCLSPDTPLVRYMELPEGVRHLTVKPPLNVLVMISSPLNLPQLDVADEWRKLNAAVSTLQPEGKVVLDRLEEPTLAALQRRLRRDSYHIFHFIGHGGFVEGAQDGALALEDDQRNMRLVSGQDLGTILHGSRSLRLVILNACEGARSSLQDPFGGVAQSLVQQGIPAVIAMQFEITDTAAIVFSKEFYSALGEGFPVDFSLTEARRAIFATGNDIEWATPVLYMRSPNGRLFRIDRRPPSIAGSPEAREPAPTIAAEPPTIPPRPAPEAPVPVEAVEAAAAPEAVDQAFPGEAVEPAITPKTVEPQTRESRTQPVAAERQEFPSTRPTTLPPPWWWIVISAGTLLVGAGIALPSFKLESGEAVPIIELSGWLALNPLAAVLGVMAAAFRTAKPEGRGVVRGVLSGLGLYSILLYLGFALLARGGVSALTIASSGSALGAITGLAGGGLLFWAGLSLPSEGGRVPASGSGSESALPLGLGLAFLGAVLLVLGTIAIPALMVIVGFPHVLATLSIHWPHLAESATTLLAYAAPLALPPIGAAAAVGLCGFASLGAMLRRDTAAGVILAIAIEALLFQVALAGATRAAGESLGGGSYVSLVAAAIMVAGAVLTFRALPRLTSEAAGDHLGT
jgi:hypothetical protein